MRTILFDVDGVLIHSMFHPDPARHRSWSEHIEMDFGISRDDFNQFFRKDFGDIVRGKKSIVTALDEFLPSIGASVNAIDFLAYWFEKDTPLNFKLLEGIKQLQRKADVKIYLATNQEHLRAYHLWKELRLSHIFDDMFYAARLGSAKPDVAFFEKVQKQIGEQTEKPLLFDDGQKNVDAANQFGWEGAMFLTEDDFFNHPWIKEQLS